MNELVHRREFCSESAARRVAAMLDIDPAPYGEGTVLPRGWHFVLMGADARRASVRADGFAGLGVPMPDLGLPRLMLAGRSVTWHGDLPIGAPVQRSSGVREIQHKTNASGPMAIVTVAHELRVVGAAQSVITETQTYMLLPHRAVASPARDATRIAQSPRVTPPTHVHHVHHVTPDETMLFQYSALGFNAHKIHLDRAYAQGVEGFPDLVVNGGLTTLLMTELLRQLGHLPVTATLKYSAPLFCNRPIALTADATSPENHWQLRAADDTGGVAVTMDVGVAHT